MNRRGFLSLLAPAAALIVAPELLLPKRTFFLPPAGGWGDGYAEFHRRAYERAWNNIVNPPITATEILARNAEAFSAANLDRMAYGMGVISIKPGGVHWAPTVRHVPLDEFTLDP